MNEFLYKRSVTAGMWTAVLYRAECIGPTCIKDDKTIDLSIQKLAILISIIVTSQNVNDCLDTLQKK